MKKLLLLTILMASFIALLSSCHSKNVKDLAKKEFANDTISMDRPFGADSWISWDFVDIPFGNDSIAIIKYKFEGDYGSHYSPKYFIYKIGENANYKVTHNKNPLDAVKDWENKKAKYGLGGDTPDDEKLAVLKLTIAMYVMDGGEEIEKP